MKRLNSSSACAKKEGLTSSGLNPKAEPKTMARRHNQPMVSRRGRGSLYQGSSTAGIQTALTGRVITELGINLKAITLRI
jgi:hypothetical protein